MSTLHQHPLSWCVIVNKVVPIRELTFLLFSLSCFLADDVDIRHGQSVDELSHCQLCYSAVLGHSIEEGVLSVEE